MNAQVISYISSFVLAGCAILALLIIVPAASASAQQLKPGWRAWVWPLAFMAFGLSSLFAGFGLSFLPADTSGWVLWRDLLLGLGLTLIVLNSVYRLLVRRTAPYFAPFIWCGFGCFATSILAFATDRAVTLSVFVGVGALILLTVYSGIYMLERERASDAIPALVAAALTSVSDVTNSLNFKLDLGFLSFNQEFATHLLQIPAIFFFLIAANNGYVVKYALHRRQQREHLLVEAES